MGDSDSGYELGSADDELARLELQGRALAPATRMIFDVPTSRALPASPLLSQAVAWIAEAFARGGIQPSVGARLWAVVREAGLRPLGMTGVQPHFGPGDPAAVGLLAGIIRTIAPLIERTGVATAEQIGVGTFAQRLQAQLEQTSAVVAHPILLSAWATTGAA